MKNLLIIFACLCLLGCRQASDKTTTIESEEVIADSILRIKINDISENAVLKCSDIFDQLSYVKLETKDSCLIGRISKIIATDDKYVILDESIAKMIFVFDLKGRFLNRIGNIGSGPEEYDCPDDIAYDKYNDDLLVWCHNKKTILCFKLDGTFVRKIETDWWAPSLFVTGENQYALFLNNYKQADGKPNDNNILIFNKKGELLRSLLPYNKNTGTISPPSGHEFSTYGNEILFSPYLSNKVFKLEQKNLVLKYYYDFGKKNISPSFFNDISNKDLFNKINKQGYAFNIAFKETSTHLISKFVSKGLTYNCFYSKKSGIVNCSALFFNDMYALSPTGVFACMKGDTLINYIESHSFINTQTVLNEIKKGKDDIRKRLINKLLTSNIPPINAQLKDNLSKAIETSTISLSDEEINFINSIDESDNPVLMISKLKEF